MRTFKIWGAREWHELSVGPEFIEPLTKRKRVIGYVVEEDGKTPRHFTRYINLSMYMTRRIFDMNVNKRKR